ncbi:NAD(+) diphosphatase [Sphingomonas floccifaciens]|uniref:NAD(+) diphosphatase n=1 Tax=Sphingomonas floccifaciens TaxID=1844115 RepID=A0ABW4NF17_9SPHN
MIATGFTGAWLDRADPVRGDPALLDAALADPRARLMRLENGDPAVDATGAIAWTSLADLEGTPIFLGLDAEQRPYFAETRAGDAAGPARSGALMRMLDAMPPGDAAIFGTVRSVTGWHARNGFCANCGAATAIIRGGWARACPSCGTEHYPRVDPVVIMLAEFEGRALVGRQAAWPAGRYSALVGFVEPGESLEEAVAREVFEEAGVRVSDVRYLASQPWPFPGQLMLAAIGAAESDALTIDAKEIEDAFWVTKADVRAALAGEADAKFLPPPPYAIARTLLEEWAK